MAAFDSTPFGGGGMPSAPDAGAGWGALLPWEASALDDDLDEECSFAPHIKSVKGVSSTMGDFMESWSKQRERHILDSRAERHTLQRQELPFRPELPAKATNETLLRSAGYKGPVQAWRQHADHYKQVRESSSPAGSGAHTGREQASPSKPSRQRSWSAVVDRLYPFPNAALEQAAPASEDLQPVLGVALRDKAGGADLGAGGGADDSMVSMDSSAAIETSTRTSALRQHLMSSTAREAVSPKRRLGRPPKATWQYLYESGTRQLRGKSQPAPVESAPVPRPIQRSEELCQRQDRHPLWIPKSLQSATPRARVQKTPRSVTPTPSARSARPASAHAGGSSSSAISSTRAGLRLYERCERQKELQEQRRSLAHEMKRAEEMRECSFRPRTNRGMRASAAHGDENISLYDRGVRGQLRKRLLEEEGAAEKAEAELRECTFRPSIRRNRSFAAHQDDSVASSCPRLYDSREEPSDRSQATVRRDEASLQQSVDEPQDLTSSVLALLHEWKAQEIRHGPMPDCRLPSMRAAAPGVRMPPVPAETPGDSPEGFEPELVALRRQDRDTSLDMQELLDEWRSSWTAPLLAAGLPNSHTCSEAGEGTAPDKQAWTGVFAEIHREGPGRNLEGTALDKQEPVEIVSCVPMATLNETRAEGNLRSTRDGHEASVFDMLASWRAGASAALSSPASSAIEPTAPAVVQSASVSSLRAEPTPHPYPEA
mmetsp:Transcript_70961/g.123054  ORF Transcript_70961/g.123054 Transcript_70961/m.123054 type:complete len:715 (-) Transcript_70961:58-2202(-)